MPQPVLILIQHHAHPSSFGSGKHPTQKRRCEACTLWIGYLKLDVEGMEEEVLRGASASIAQHRPILLVERIKSNGQALEAFFAHHGYRSFMTGMNYLAIHPSDPSLASIRKS
jgi:hypothetical protein